MATHLVNLDALISREDFESGQGKEAAARTASFKVPELHHEAAYFHLLRKPDFQRETSNWSPQMIADFVQSFLDDEVIPSIITWQSKHTNRIFVIDGSHRVSALIAWVNDDYGDGPISRDFFAHNVPDKQREFHKATKALIESQVGSFQRLNDIARRKINANNATEER